MRIISGKYKGRIINAPKGLDVRPTTDRVREAMFSSIISLYGNLENTCVLDAFAGSGALGIESISRGSAFLVSFENNKKTYENLVKNLQLLNIEEEKAKIIFADVKNSKYEYVSKNKFDILFFDPPYETDGLEVLKILKQLKNSDMLNKNALVVYEHSASNDFENYVKSFADENFENKNVKIYGDIAIQYLLYLGE